MDTLLATKEEMIKNVSLETFEDEFENFKKILDQDFITQKTNYNGVEYYFNTYFYEKGNVNLKYIIRDKEFKNFFSMADLRMHKNGERFFSKLFSKDIKEKLRDNILNQFKPDVYYFKFNFSIFKTILIRYLFEFKHKKNLNIWDTDFNIFSLINNEEFMSVVDRFDMNTKSLKMSINVKSIEEINKEVLINLAVYNNNIKEEDVEVLQKVHKNIVRLSYDFKRRCTRCKNEYSFQKEFRYKNIYMCKLCLSEYQKKRYRRIKDEITKCECGQNVKKYSINSHKKSKKHKIQVKCKNFLNNWSAYP